MHCPVVSPFLDHSPHCSYLGSHDAVACVSVCLSSFADMCESVCGYVCECWCLSAEWGGWADSVTKCKQERLACSPSASVSVCACVCKWMFQVVHKDLFACELNKTTSFSLNLQEKLPVKDAPFFTDSFRSSGALSVLLAPSLPLETGHEVWSAPLASSQHHFPHFTLHLL